MSKFIKYTAYQLAFVFALSRIVAIYLKLSLTPQRINSQKVHPKVLEYGLIYNGCHPALAAAYRNLYERGDLKTEDISNF